MLEDFLRFIITIAKIIKCEHDLIQPQEVIQPPPPIKLPLIKLCVVLPSKHYGRSGDMGKRI